MIKIGEFSKLMQVSIRMLRYYDETGLLKPSEVDEITGYRSYSLEQIERLHRIIFLRDTGLNVSEIAIALNNWNCAFITNQLEKKKEETMLAIKSQQEKINKINIAIKDINEEKISIHYNVSMKSMPAQNIISLRRKIPDYFNEGILWEEIYNFIEHEHIDISKKGDSFAIYHDTEYKESNVDVEVCVVVNRIGENKEGFIFRETEKIDTIACIMVYGPYENIATAYESFAHWLIKHDQYKMTGQNRQICHRGSWNEEDTSKYLTEIQIPVKIS